MDRAFERTFGIKALLELFVKTPGLDEIICQEYRELITIQGSSKALIHPLWDITAPWAFQLQEFVFSQGLRLDPLWPCAGGSYYVKAFSQHFRWHAILPPLSGRGAIFSIRRHRFSELGLTSFADWHPNHREQLDEAMACGRPVFVTGLTAAGKSSFLAALLYEYCSHERVAILEEFGELPLLSQYWMQLQCCAPTTTNKHQITLDQLANEVLRLRPDRIALGEIRCGRGGIALARSLETNHHGVMTTFHVANKGMLHSRLASLLPKSGRHLLEQANPLCIHLERGLTPRICNMELLFNARAT